MAADNAVGPILRRQAHAMQKIQSSFEPLTLFPVEAVPEPRPRPCFRISQGATGVGLSRLS